MNQPDRPTTEPYEAPAAQEVDPTVTAETASALGLISKV